MMRKLLYSTDKKILIAGAVVLLVTLCAVPVPSVISFSSVEKELESSTEKLNGYSKESVEHVGKEKTLSVALRSLVQQMENRFKGINSDLRLRNIILKVCEISDISTSSCKLNGTKRLTETDTVDPSLTKGIHAVTMEVTGTAFLEDLLVFVNTLESLNIGLQVSRFSTAKAGKDAAIFTFSLTLDGFFVTDESAGIPGTRRGD